MYDTEVFQQILGLQAPWMVADVKLDLEAGQVDIRVEHAEGSKFSCPECGCELACYDHVTERRWRHLDTMQYRTILYAKPPRVKCPEHGVKQVNLPWAEKNSRFTLFFERFAINVLLATQTVQGAAGILRTSWDETWHIVKKAVARGKARKTDTVMPRIGIDEKAFRKGQNYITLIYDLDRSTVEAISDGNDTAAGNACFSQLSPTQRDSVEAIAMDMNAAYVKAAKENIPLADWYKRVIHTKLTPLKKVAKTIAERLTNVVSYCTHRITNAVAEGMNSKIMSIKRRVGGYHAASLWTRGGQPRPARPVDG